MAREHRQTGTARLLRRNSTEAERELWRHLRDRQLCGAKFRRQAEINGYIVDFLCADRRLIIEADGGQHSLVADAIRTAHLESQGFRILRFWNNDILENLHGVCTIIQRELEAPPHPAC